MIQRIIHFCLTLLALSVLGTATAAAQGWRVGVTAGAGYNVHSMDMQYMSDFRTEGRWGATLGVSGQYSFTDWLGVRADLSWTQKNYRQYRTVLSEVDYKYRNNYLLLPVMASFSFGGKRLRGFANVGIYGGYWMNSSRWDIRLPEKSPSFRAARPIFSSFYAKAAATSSPPRTSSCPSGAMTTSSTPAASRSSSPASATASPATPASRS